MAGLDLVDLTAASADDQFIAACEDLGFVVVSGHGIDPALFVEMRSVLQRVFAVDDEVKAAGAITRDNYRGFIPLGFFTPNRREVNGVVPDRYEGYKLHWECPDGEAECALYGPNRWLDEVPELRSVVHRYWDACDGLAAQLLAVCARAMGLDEAEFLGWHERPLTNMTLLHYPAQPADDAAVGIHPHKDTNVLTLLHPDPGGGLEVRRADGTWIDVDTPTDTIVVNIGEMLELWSGGRFVATPHRVVNRTGRARYSFPYFVVPNHAVVVEPLVPRVPGFGGGSMPVGALSEEVWRTNWPDETPDTTAFDLGSLRPSDL